MLQPIGIVKSCFREKFGIPRQSGLVPEARAVIELQDSAEMRDSLRGLEGFSHIWVIFVFHGAEKEGWKPLVRPPRLGGARKVGVLATRSPHRPNPIGMSLVELERVDGVELHIRGVDLLDGTPVLDVKPYIPYADSVEGARTGWVEESDGELPRVKVEFSEGALVVCREIEASGAYPEFRQLIEKMLALDPRPAFQVGESALAEYAAKVCDYDVHWEVRSGTFWVTRIEFFDVVRKSVDGNRLKS